MATLAENITKAVNDFDDIQAAIIQKGVAVPDDTPTSEYGNKILQIPSGGGSGGWQPPSDWWDIKTMVDTGVLEWSGETVANVRYGYVVSDGYPTTKLVAGYEYYLSDGSYYNGAATHTWDRSRDKPCSEGYMTRAVIVVKAANRDVAISQRSLALDGIASLYIYLGDCNVTTVAHSSGTAPSSANKGLRAVVSSASATLSSGALAANYAVAYCTALAVFNVRGATSLGNYALRECTALASLTISDSVTSLVVNMLYGCSALAVLVVPVGFSLPIDLSSLLLLSPTSLEQLIDNAADMTGQTAITFTLGADNLAKLSAEYKALAAAKNITLA